MPRPCSICRHSQRAAIDRELVAGTPVTRIAAEYRVSDDALARHKAAHLPAVLARARQDHERAHLADLAGQVAAQEKQEQAHALDVVQQLKVINQISNAILHEARQARDAHTALRAIDRVQRQIELQARLLGELDERPQVNVLLAPEWVSIRGTVLSALAPFPEARAAVAQQLLALEGCNGHHG
jgi:hypothetical protein